MSPFLSEINIYQILRISQIYRTKRKVFEDFHLWDQKEKGDVQPEILVKSYSHSYVMKAEYLDPVQLSGSLTSSCC